MKPTKNKSIQIERCPYLGLHDDESTSLAYASPWNYCYHASPPASVVLAHQGETCLGAGYAECPVLLSNQWGALPRPLRGRRAWDATKLPSRRRTRVMRVLLVVLALLLLAFAAWYFEVWQYFLVLPFITGKPF